MQENYLLTFFNIFVAHEKQMTNRSNICVELAFTNFAFAFSFKFVSSFSKLDIYNIAAGRLKIQVRSRAIAFQHQRSQLKNINKVIICL